MSESSSPRDPGRPGFRPLQEPSPDRGRFADGGETARSDEPASFDPYDLRPDPFGTGPKLSPRRSGRPEGMKTATVGASAAGFSRSATDELPPPPPRTAPPGDGRRSRVPIWAAAVAGLALAAVLFAAATRDRDRAATPDDAGDAQIEVVDRPREAAPEPAPVVATRPTDADAVARAYDDASLTYRAEGLPGLAARSRACFEGLRGAPAFDRLDYCLAFDAVGAAVQQRLAGGAPLPADSWFGQSQARGAEAVRRIAPEDVDPAARVLDVRRVLGEVGRLRRAQAPAAGPPPAAEPAPLPAPVVVPSVPTPIPRASSPTPWPAQPRAAPVSPGGEPRPPSRAEAGAAAPAERPRARPVPAPVPVRPAAKAEPRPAAPPVARRAPSRDFSPSFDCRYARTRAEIAVCDDPRLAAADRALSRAYEGAIARGADRRDLRDEQDQWLRVRERAAPDPGAIEDAYRRRIRELEARNRSRRNNLDNWF